MKPATRYVLTFVGGLSLGAVVAAFLVSRRWEHDFANWYVSGVAGQAYSAREIYRGRCNQEADRIRKSLPGYVLAVEGEFRNAQGRDAAYWLVRDVYEATGVPFPAQIRTVLTSLPPRPLCKPPVAKVLKNGAA
jgi:hypothetical protein